MLRKNVLTLCSLFVLALSCTKNEGPGDPTHKTEITVYDGSLWSATDTLGKPVADADVALYSTRENYSLLTAAYSTKTDASGKATFTGLTPGTYYMFCGKGDKTNLFGTGYVNSKVVTYKATGIFQTTAQVSAMPHLANAVPGDFIFADVNMDGKIDVNDRVEGPVEVTVTNDQTVQIRSYIGYTANHTVALFTNKENAQQFLDNLYTQVGNWHQQQTVMDGILSDDADCTGMSGYCEMDNFTFTANSTPVANLWSNAYDYISACNRIILNVSLLNLPAADANLLIAQAKGLRAFIYMNLATYYGQQPLLTAILPNISNMVRRPLDETWNFVKTDLTNAMNQLPAVWTGADYHRIGANACKLLLARVAMMQGDYTTARQYTSDLIAAGAYQLVANANDIFTNDTNAEIIWNLKTGIQSQYNTFFTAGGTRNFNPAIRYAEALLINSEASIRLGELNANYVNQLLARRSQATVVFTDATQAITTLQSVWKSEQAREGQRFAKIVKWGIALTVLQSKGYSQYKSLLPIPMAILEIYSNLQQNPGY